MGEMRGGFMDFWTEFINTLVHISVMIATLIILYIFIFMFIDSVKALKKGIHEKNRHDEFTYFFYIIFSIGLIIGITIAAYRNLDLPQFIAVIVLIVLIITVRIHPKLLK